jgi:hypothetical protein
MVYSRIWLNPPKDNHHFFSTSYYGLFGYIKKLPKKKKKKKYSYFTCLLPPVEPFFSIAENVPKSETKTRLIENENSKNSQLFTFGFHFVAKNIKA